MAQVSVEARVADLESQLEDAWLRIADLERELSGERSVAQLWRHHKWWHHLLGGTLG